MFFDAEIPYDCVDCSGEKYFVAEPKKHDQWKGMENISHLFKQGTCYGGLSRSKTQRTTKRT